MFQVGDCGLRRQPLNNVQIGLADDLSSVVAALGLGGKSPGGVTELLGSNVLCCRKRRAPSIGGGLLRRGECLDGCVVVRAEAFVVHGYCSGLRLKARHEPGVFALTTVLLRGLSRETAIGRCYEVPVILENSGLVAESLGLVNVGRRRIAGFQSLRPGYLAFQTENKVRGG